MRGEKKINKKGHLVTFILQVRIFAFMYVYIYLYLYIAWFIKLPLLINLYRKESCKKRNLKDCSGFGREDYDRQLEIYAALT